MDFKGKTKNIKDMSGLWGVCFSALDNPSFTPTWDYFAAWILLSFHLILTAAQRGGYCQP